MSNAHQSNRILWLRNAHEILRVQVIERVVWQTEKFIYHCVIISVATRRWIRDVEEKHRLTYTVYDVTSGSDGEEQREEQVL